MGFLLLLGEFVSLVRFAIGASVVDRESVAKVVVAFNVTSPRVHRVNVQKVDCETRGLMGMVKSYPVG